MGDQKEFRNYKQALPKVTDNYRKARERQTLDFVKKMIKNYEERPKVRMHVWDAIEKLNDFIDDSDPDIDLPNLHHLFQTAEAIRKDGHPEWLQLVGLIHDLGKILYLWGSDIDGTSLKEQWAIVGDTFLVGCPIPDSIVYPEFNQNNPDNGTYIHCYTNNTDLGIYQKGCGLNNCICSWGHDEYLYRVLKDNGCDRYLPEWAFYIIRFHSLYVWHKESEYQDLMEEKDKEGLKWVQLFNKYDLYTKENTEINIEKLKPYYQGLIKKYLGNDSLLF